MSHLRHRVRLDRLRPWIVGIIAAVVLGTIVGVAAERALLDVRGISSAGAKSTPSPTATVMETTAPSVVPSPSVVFNAGVDRLAQLGLDGTSQDPRRVYDVSADGLWWAYRDQWSGPGPLHLGRQGEPTLDLRLGPTEVSAPQAAAFSPNGSRLAVVDGGGALWVVDAASGSAIKVADAGPNGLVFGRWVRFGDGDHVYVQLVGSVEIPIPSFIAAVNVQDGTITTLSDDSWAYGPRLLADGSIAYVHLNNDGSYVVRRLREGGEVTDMAQVGTADWIDVSTDGVVAFSDGLTTFLVSEPGGTPVPVGGMYPRFSPGGRTLLTYDSVSGQSILYSLDGSVVDTMDSAFAAIVQCGEGCVR